MSVTAKGGLGRPVVYSSPINSNLTLSDFAYAVITHSFNRDWVIVNFATLDMTNNACWYNITNFYSSELTGNIVIRIYDVV